MKKYGYLLLLLLCASHLFAQSDIELVENFNDPLVKYDKAGRGLCKIENSVLTTRDAYLGFGETNWADYEVKFSARVPDTAKQVQICAGFRAANRDDRYILMLKGGMQKFLYLARLGYMGADDFLALRELDFQPVPGKWYNFRIQLAGNRIRVFIGNEVLPRIDIVDKSSNLAPAGKVTLGGSWITNQFDNLSITSLNKNEILAAPVKEYEVAPVNKEALRKQQRASYKPLNIVNINNTRTDISLDGKWLFTPDYETDDAQAVSPKYGDDNWHIMHVPEFWTPIRVWLHGERYNSGSKGVADNYYQKETDRCAAYTFDYKKTNTGWYRQWIELPQNIKGKHLQLSFDAVSKVAEVWVNGVKAGDHIGMFGDFKLDVTSLLKPGKNLIAVKVGRIFVKNIKNADKITDVAVSVEVTEKMLKDLAHGMFGDDPGGIWQPVTLTVTSPVRVQDVFIKPNLTGADIDVTVKNYDKATQAFSLSTAIVDTKLKQFLLYKDISLKQLELKPGEEKTFTYSITGLHPKLWSPEHPNLYNFRFTLLAKGGSGVIDEKTIRSGFRTFKAIGDYFYLNGKKYWLRGANQTAMPLAPNDTLLADKFCKLMKAGNVMVTRSHTVPYNETWLNASDENGIGVSYEGTWTWLFLQSSMPDKKLVDLWRDEFFDLIKKYRNHPSLLLWTVNNEMKFYDNDPDIERAKIKMKIISDVVKQMRIIDPTRSVVFDSNYHRNTKRFGADFYKDIDDGDIDDIHAYYNWYDNSLFDYFNGEFQKRFKNPGRPLISQEMSTGYEDETGHPTRFYNYVHQTSSALVGKYGYEYNDPYYFTKIEAFNTKELAEAFRRTDDQSAGILHFSLATWFSNAYLTNSIKPFPIYYDMKKALQPVLVSAELWGRHFYAGALLSTRICVVNDQEDGSVLPASTLHWQLVNNKGVAITQGKLNIPAVEHYTRKWVEPNIVIPENLPADRIDAKLQLTLVENDKTVSENSYDVLLMNKKGVNADALSGKKIAVLDLNKTTVPSLDFLGVKYKSASSVDELIKQKADVYILSGLDSVNTDATATKQIRALINSGAKVLVSLSGNFAHQLYPEYIRGTLKTAGEVMSMDIPESDVFNGLEPLDTRNFTDNKREIPTVVAGAFRINRGPNVEAPASFTKVHGYLQGQIDERMARLDGIRGYPVVKIKDNGRVILSELLTEKAQTDPVAAKLLINILTDLAK